MKIILLSGGSGKRLWPLSNDLRSKQFLKVLRNDCGEMESMVQRVWRQLENVGLAQSAYVATGKTQVEMIHSQLSDQVPIIIEPERRDTFPAIALAASYLYSMADIDLDQTIAVLPVDSYVEDEFFIKIRELETILNQSGADLALVGVKPTYPSEKYGYIIPYMNDELETNLNYSKVKTFKEKPSEDEAQQYIEQHALWNCGVFAFKLGYLIELLIDRKLPLQYEEMTKQYGKLEKISFDYEVIEKTDRVVALPYEGHWKDLGTWNTLTEEIASNVIGKGMISEDSKDTHLINELDIPVAILGLPHVVVASSPDGILVVDKSSSPKLKDFIKDMEQRPMYEERRWGYYRVLDYQKFDDGHEVLTKRICIRAGKNSSYQYHLHRDEFWTITAGLGEMIMDDRLLSVKAGDVIKIPAGTLHSIRAMNDMELIEVQTGSEIVEEDVVILTVDWTQIIHSVS
ncbi:sugar phosphate nucleotidyltransferase [Paenibacillus sediminis]|uniref:Mannose-1-phosphate guanylyltransferase n=1 Tax=Paenibacillus sediminis TaxID=664909 RepID=A0ABS4H4D0_9BACL|nr:sugar phosphate nucleotidyltransferase [Paenibacillus sediminis]MBP1937389.1 mannose-1-phosphate guanylyltransferase [Paenibacillus sediminis]